MICRLKLEVPENIRQLVIETFDFIGLTRKIRFELTEENWDLLYSVNVPENSLKALHCNPDYYNPDAKFRYEFRDQKHLWLPDGNNSKADHAGTIFRFINLIEERSVSHTGSGTFTSFMTNALSSEHKKVLDIPITDYNSMYLCSYIQSYDAGAQWSEKSKLTVVLTHDVDGPEISNNQEITKSFAKFILRRKYKFFWQFFNGFKARLKGDKGDFWRFTEWAEFEQKFGAASVFFVYPGIDKNSKHFNDPAYRVTSNSRWKVLNQLEEMGSEIGLQPGINAKLNKESFRQDKEFLENMGLTVSGTRHHYWELNWRNPWETLRHHSEAGLLYDMSISWKDRAGFRMGTAFPHVTARLPVKNHVSIPSSVMDGHFFDYQKFEEEKCFDEVLRLIEHIRNTNGLLVLDWHERTFEDTPVYKGYFYFYKKILEHISTRYKVNWMLGKDVYTKVMKESEQYGIRNNQTGK